MNEKLLALQAEIEPIKKDSNNPFFHSKYFDINSLIAVLKPLLTKHGLVLTQPLGGNAVSSVITDVKSGEKIASTMILPEIQDPQKLGSAITYFRRYTLQSLLALEAEDDDANVASGKVDALPKKRAYPTRVSEGLTDEAPF